MKIGFGEDFRPGTDKVQFAGIIWGEPEREAIQKVLDYGWRGPGQYAHQLEKRLAEYMGLKKASLTNSGSSANLLALTALKELHDLEDGDEIIVPASSFPTTVNPIIQLGFVPVFVDIELGTYNIDTSLLEEAHSDKVRGVMLAHMLGIPCDIDGVLDYTNHKNSLLFIEDCCDAMGSMYKGEMVGTFGDIATLSFYASHHMSTAGLGGVALSNNSDLIRIVRSLKEWGKMCTCEPCPITADPNKSCVFNYEQNIDGIEGYDRRYSYARLGHNMQMTELQAAFGLAQMDRLGEFAEARSWNAYRLDLFFGGYRDWLILPPFDCYSFSQPNWFAYPLTIRDEAPFTRLEIVRYLEDHKIETRLLFGGNLARQPAYKNIKMRIGSSLENSDKVMRDTFFIGVWPGINKSQMDYMLEVLEGFLSAF